MSAGFPEIAFERFARDGQSRRSFLLGQIELCNELIAEAAMNAERDWQGNPLIFVRIDRQDVYPEANLFWFGFRARHCGQQHCLNYAISIHHSLRLSAGGRRVIVPDHCRSGPEEIVGKLTHTASVWAGASRPFRIFWLNRDETGM